MSLTINTNPAAIRASFNLAKNNKNLQDSLTRLSSGKRITKPADDAGGLAVSMKLTASINRTRAAISNIQNSLSFGEVQDGALQAATRIVDRLAELKSLSLDVMKSSADISNYNTEFQALQQRIHFGSRCRRFRRQSAQGNALGSLDLQWQQLCNSNYGCGSHRWK